MIRYYEITLFRDFEGAWGARFRDDEISGFRGALVRDFEGRLINPSCAVAVRVGAAAPKFFAGVDAFLCHSLEHWFTANGARWGVVANAFLCAICQSFCSEAFGEAACLPEVLQLALHLAVQHQYEALA